MRNSNTTAYVYKNIYISETSMLWRRQ